MRRVDVPEGAESDPDPDPGSEEQPAVSAYRTSPNRTVFAEEGNSDAWIATDLVVDVDG